MKVLQLFNQYRSGFTGEEAVVHATAALVEKHGGTASLWMPSSRDLEGRFSGKLRAFISGMYSGSAYREMVRRLREERPSVVHAHNLYPLLSPSVLVACRHEGVPVVLSVHNQSFTCPNSDHLCHGKLCERCLGGREYHCVLRNCRGDLMESLAYALRSRWARRRRLFFDNVTRVIALSQFARARLLFAGFAAEQIVVLPNWVSLIDQPANPAGGEYVLFAGRLSREKGLDVLMQAASRLSNVPFRLAGSGPEEEMLRRIAPANVEFLGRRTADEMHSLYQRARMLVLPSTCFEVCPLVVTEAMSHGLPVVASNIGGIPELVDRGETGMLFTPGDVSELTRSIQQLWDSPVKCSEFGSAGRSKAECCFHEDKYFAGLRGVYADAIRAVGRPLPESLIEVVEHSPDRATPLPSSFAAAAITDAPPSVPS